MNVPFPVSDLRLSEMRHRYANAVQLAASLLTQQARCCAEPAANRALLDAAGRLGAVHHLYFTLDADGIEADQPARVFLQALCHHLRAAYLADAGIACSVDAAEVRLPVETCRLLGLCVHELVVNAAKHAFPGGRRGQVTVRLHPAGDGLLRCTVEDDGVGFAATARHRVGLGRQLVGAIAHQLQGCAVWVARPGGGGAVHLDIPGGFATHATACMRPAPEKA